MNPIFLSYTAKGRSNADRLRTALQENGIETWMDSEIVPGEHWGTTLQEKLRDASAVVFLIGPDGQVSEQQRNEATAVFRAEWGAQKKTPLIPVVTSEAELPPFLRQVPAIEVKDVEKGWTEAAERIKQSLSGAPVEVAVPSPGESEQKARLLGIWEFADSLSRSSKSSAASGTTGAATASGSSGYSRASKSSGRKS